MMFWPEVVPADTPASSTPTTPSPTTVRDSPPGSVHGGDAPGGVGVAAPARSPLPPAGPTSPFSLHMHVQLRKLNLDCPAKAEGGWTRRHSFSSIAQLPGVGSVSSPSEEGQFHRAASHSLNNSRTRNMSNVGESLQSQTHLAMQQLSRSLPRRRTSESQIQDLQRNMLQQQRLDEQQQLQLQQQLPPPPGRPKVQRELLRSFDV